MSDSQATKPAAATDAGRNPIYEGQFDGETPEQAAHRLHWAKAGLAMGRDVAAAKIESQAREIERLSTKLRSALLDSAELAALKAQPSGMVLPEPMKRGDEGGSGEYGAAMIRGYNACLREVACLNQQPASGGDDAERAAFEAAAWRVTGRDGLTVTAQYPKWAEADCLLTITPLYAHPAALPVREAVAEGSQIQVCKLGRLGAAYDPADTRYAYTYTDQPDNVGAMKLGRAAAINGTKRHGDEIDRGLHLLLQLQAEGFGVFQLAAAPSAGSHKEQGE